MTIKSMVLGPVQTNCYFLINDETKEVLIIDPADNAAGIEGWIREEGLEPRAILLTHGHFDHILGVEGLRKAFDIPVYAGKNEADVLKDPRKNVSPMLGRSVSVSADRLLSDNEIFTLAGIRMQVFFTPGHTEGSVCFYLPDEKKLFSGDTLFEASVGRTDFPTGSSRQLVDAIKTRLFILDDDVMVYPGHGGCTSIGYEKTHNPFVY